MLEPMWWQKGGLAIATLASIVHDEVIAARKVEGRIDRPPTSRSRWELRVGQQVSCQDGHAGRVTLLLLGPDGQARSFVMKMGYVPSRRIVVPVEWVCGVDKQVHLGVERHSLDSLPPYRSGGDIAAEVDRALWNDRAFRRTGYYRMHITVSQGVVSLTGYVLMPSHRDRAEQVARTVPGVLGIENHLVSDQELEIQVARALAGDVSILGHLIYVHANNGDITLSGRVDSAAVRASAEECAARVPQVESVVNHIKTPGLDEAEDQRVLRPRIGQEVLGTDAAIGRVERVMISLHNRRVVAVLVRVRIPDSWRTFSHTILEMPEPERQILIPMSQVRFVTQSVVQLDISGIEAAQYDDLKDAAFTSPRTDWQPPYPYRHGDVLLESSGATELISRTRPVSGIPIALPIQGAVRAKIFTEVAS